MVEESSSIDTLVGIVGLISSEELVVVDFASSTFKLKFLTYKNISVYSSHNFELYCIYLYIDL